MLELLLAIFAIVAVGAGVVWTRRRFVGDSWLGWQCIGMDGQAYRALMFRVGWPAGGLCGRGGIVAWATLARPAPPGTAAALHGWSIRARGRRWQN